MTSKRLTDRYIAGLKPKAERYEVWEPGRTGFGVRVFPSGKKSFVYMYRMNGKARRMTIGSYPATSLSRARVLFANASEQKDKGIDPGAAKIEKRRAERGADTVSDLIGEYLEKHARPKKRSADQDERMLRVEVEPHWGKRKAKDITRRDIIGLLDAIVERGSPVTANRCLAVIRRMFRFAIQKDILGATPCVEIEKPAIEKSRDRVLSPSEIKTFWAKLEDADMSVQARLALKLMLVTAQRREEVTRAPWSEFDLDECVWEIPANRSKNGRAHRVPLSTLAVELLGQIKEAGKNKDGEASECLFPSRTKAGPIEPHAVSKAARRNLDHFDIEPFTPHDLRRTAASRMTEMGIARLTVSKILNHSDRSVTGIYDRFDYAVEKQRALEAWGERLREILSGKKAAANVVELATSA